jgi:hypothetical protein
MTSAYLVIREEFDEELAAVKALVEAFESPEQGDPRTRVASVNSAILLLAATFEEFVREMARAYARAVVAKCESWERLPANLAGVAWKRTMESLARVKLDRKEGLPPDALARFNVAYGFCSGDLSQDIYEALIHNENNMRATEINSLFKISGLSDVCRQVCDRKPLQDFFEGEDATTSHGLLLRHLDDFIERRNQVAHSIASTRSSGPDVVLKDLKLLDAFAASLTETLEGL